jgi:ferric-dicitrate binding protein FerR (iron transport regulator)
MDAGRFAVLLERYRLGEATAAEAAELERLLRADASLRRAFVREFLLEVQLRRAFSSVPEPVGRPRPTPRRLGWVVALSAAAVLLLALGVGLVSWLARPGARKNAVVSGDVRLQGVAVQQVPEGAAFEVGGDAPAVLRLSDGSRAEFLPASEGVLHGRRGAVRQAVELKQGAGKFQVTPGAGTFQVETAVGVVSALGTEFTVKLQSRGKGEKKRREKNGSPVMTVTVTEGSVKVEARGKSSVLKAGDTRDFADRPRREGDDDD